MTSSHPYPNLALLAIAQRLVDSSSWVLDVGCHQGEMGKILKKVTGGHIVGLDRDSHALREAKKVLDGVILADLERWPGTSRHFNLVIASNILEHLKDPRTVLLRLKGCLKPGGQILLAIPNIAFWPVRLDLLLGRFEYKNEGILNQGHLRFFTLKTLRKLIKEAELKEQFLTTSYFGWRNRVAFFCPTLLASQFIVLTSSGRR